MQFVASFLGFSAIVLGAIGAHALNLGDSSHSFEVATRYQLIHALLMLFFAHQLKNRFSWGAIIGASLIISGCMFFCLGIYLKAFTGNAFWVEAAPIGGISFMLAWVCVGFTK
ncbi:MAG: DUF423 domain-containing protein [Myxococcaceae bacterium]